MPRIPQKPGCDCNQGCAPSTASEDLKLKKLEAKLSKAIDEKVPKDLSELKEIDSENLDEKESYLYIQDKDGNPRKISLDAINAETASLLLMGKDILVTAPAGKYKKNDKIKADENIKNVIENILTEDDSPAISTNVYIYSGEAELDNISFLQTGWKEYEADESIVENGFTYIHELANIHYLAFAYPKNLGNLKHIYQNNLYGLDLIYSFEIEEFVDRGQTYLVYKYPDQMLCDNDKFEFLWK